MKHNQALVHMANATNYSTLSKAIRLKVGAVLVTKTGIEVPGYNGTAMGTDNNCENVSEFGLTTKPTVIHAELNTILKCAREGVSCVDATLFVTVSPCESCAAMIKQAGIKKVYYGDSYRSTIGIDYLRENGVEVIQLKKEQS